MPLKLVFLGRLEDIAGEPERMVKAAATLDDVIAGLDPVLAAAVSETRIRVAHNGAVVPDRGGLRVADGDEIAFLPPVSGG